MAAMNRLCEHFSIASSLVLPDLVRATYSSAAFLTTLAATQLNAWVISSRERDESDLAARMPLIPR